MTEQTRQVVVVTPTKSVGIAILLAILFGPIGMFYSTIIGAIVMVVITFILALFTAGFSLILTQPICIIWAAIAVSSHNKKLVRGTKQY